MAMFLITAPSGAGKTTITHELQKLGKWNEVISTTTRPMRDGEIPNKTYYFMEDGDFADYRQMGKFAEVVKYDGHYYGITKEEIERVIGKSHHLFIIVEHEGYKQLKNLYPDAVGIFLYMSKEDCMANMLLRGDRMDNALRRIEKYDDEMKNRDDYDYVVKNVRGRNYQMNNIISEIIQQYKVFTPKPLMTQGGSITINAEESNPFIKNDATRNPYKTINPFSPDSESVDF